MRCAVLPFNRVATNASAISLIDPGTKILTQLACAVVLIRSSLAGSDQVMDPFGPQVDLMERVIRTGSPSIYNDLHLEASNAKLRRKLGSCSDTAPPRALPLWPSMAPPSV